MASNLLNCDTAQSALACLCDGFLSDTAQSLELRDVPPDGMPDSCRGLLVHTGHMTEALEAYFGTPVELRVLQHYHNGDDLRREILLTLAGTDRVVEYGVVRMDLGYITEAARAEIVAQVRPLGEILIRHAVFRRIDPKWYFHVPADSALVQRHFGGQAAEGAFGRLGVIYCHHHPAIELLEVVTGVAA